MPLQFNIGEVTARLRRALGPRGRTPYGLDETVVPTALAFDGTEAPFRLDGIRWWLSMTSPAVAGQLSRVEIGNTTPRDMIIDRISNWTLLGASNLGIAPTVQVATPAHNGPDCFSTEGMNADLTGQLLTNNRRGPGIVLVAAVVGVVTTPLVNMPANTANVPIQHYDVGMVLPAGRVLIVECNLANNALNLNITGRQWDNWDR